MYHQRIYLTGFMGTGKTTLGRVVANCLGWEFFDIDKEIEKDQGCTVAAIVLEKGEAEFRRLEVLKLMELSARDGAVISLGGGSLIDGANLRLCKETGLLVYLKADLNTIYHRVKKKTTRPLFRSENDSEMTEQEAMAKLKTLFEIRKPGYESADITVETEADNFGKSIDRIINRIRSRKPERKRKN
ncbi:MAG: shikimate kinase [Ignavibacteriaceae bacterium]|nr:MAG: shikimate kinase [Chlorobiota bacterium]GJQ32098.1 MAG: shikimate kinase [Ignavibacteriaceae bacterium]